MRFVLCALVVGALLYFLRYMTRGPLTPSSPLLRALVEAGVKPGETEKLMAAGTHWQAQKALMTPREVHFMQNLFGVADIVALSPHIRPRSKVWWRLFNMAAQWHCDVVIVDRRTFDVVAAIELDDASHLQKRRVKRDILLNEVMRQANIPLPRDRDSQALLQTVSRFLNDAGGNKA